jgi:hypothetical protein
MALRSCPLAFDWELLKAAARAHPNWEVTADHAVKRKGPGAGPRTPNGLVRWYLEAHPQQARIVLALIEARTAQHH